MSRRCWAWPALTLLLAACQDRPATQVLVSVATDLDAPRPLEHLRMKIERFIDSVQTYLPIEGGDVIYDWPINSPPDHQYELPNAMVAFSTTDDPPKIRFTLSAYDPAAKVMIRRRAALRLVREKTLLIRMGITSRCYEDADCPDPRTCIEGRCRDPELDSSHLPVVDPDIHESAGMSAMSRPESTFACDSGTPFHNTTSGAPLVTTGQTCPNASDVCSEGTCYPQEAFGQAVPMAQNLTVRAQLSDVAGTPVPVAELRLEDGPLSLVRRLRSSPDAPAPKLPGAIGLPDASVPGLYRVSAVADRLTTEIRLTASAPGLAPQVVTIPYKPGVTDYVVPVVLFPLVEKVLAAGQPRTIPVMGASGRDATLTIGGTEPVTLRYALMDARYAPGQGVTETGTDLLQSAAVMYLESVGQGALPPDTEITLGAGNTAPVVGAEGAGEAYLLDLQAKWRKRTEAASSNAAQSALRPTTGGFWTVANHTARPACVRGQVARPDGSACPGARVRLLGPEGVSSFDSAGTDGSFCGSVAQQEALVVVVGNTSHVVFANAPARPGAQCRPPTVAASPANGDCQDLGKIVVDSDADCTTPPALAVATRQPGDACSSTLECVGLASCYSGFCVGEGYVRVSMTWAAASDFDLHVKLPGERGALSEGMREIPGAGRLDVEQCAKTCTGVKHIENIVLQAGPAAAGEYQAWVRNFGGAAAGPAEIEVFVGGVSRVKQTVTVPMAQDGNSEMVKFTLP
jgi:hypothetical protein